MGTSKNKIRVLAVDDETQFVKLLQSELTREGFLVSTATDGDEGIKMLEEKEFDVCILDMNMPRLNGMEVLKKASEQAIPTEFIVLTADATVSTAIESMRLGAYDYVTKPCDLQRITLLINKAHDKRHMKQESLILKRLREGHGKIVTKDPGILKLLQEAERVARTDATVLLQGESGTGKELMAEYIHGSSTRSKGPFIAFNVAAIQETLLESELFGYEKGAFTGASQAKAGLFELADGGTIFLDEIGEIPHQTQVKLLRVIENGSFYKVGGTKEVYSDVRVVTATNKELRAMAEDKSFREDLYYRLSSVTFDVPPLRRRKGDIPVLVDEFLSRMPVGYRKGIEKEALDLLIGYDWPGNVRELQNVLNRAAILSNSEHIEVADLPAELKAGEIALSAPKGPLPMLKDVESEHIKRALDYTGGHRKKTAEMLGVNVKTLWRKIKEYGLE
ncbi:MAG: sigma-54 dependent transcriptional regulator [Thermodesulfobacteriota bacterium]